MKKEVEGLSMESTARLLHNVGPMEVADVMEKSRASGVRGRIIKDVEIVNKNTLLYTYKRAMAAPSKRAPIS